MSATCFVSRRWPNSITPHDRGGGAKAGRDREAGIQAVRDFFYRGEIGRELMAFSEAKEACFRMADMEEAEATEEDSVPFTFGGYELHACNAWTQGPALLQVLALLEGIDLRAMGHNSADYMHTLTEAIKVAFADRDAYYGDPKFVPVPFDELLSHAYAAERRQAHRSQRSLDRQCRRRGRCAVQNLISGVAPPHEEEPATGEQSNPDTTIGARHRSGR